MGRRQFTQNDTFWEKYRLILKSMIFFEYLIGVIDVDVVVLRWWRKQNFGGCRGGKEKKVSYSPTPFWARKLQWSILQESWDILEIDSNIHFPWRFAV